MSTAVVDDKICTAVVVFLGQKEKKKTQKEYAKNDWVAIRVVFFLMDFFVLKFNNKSKDKKKENAFFFNLIF